MTLSDFAGRFRRATFSTRYDARIDGLRFIAIAIVLLWHGGLRAGRAYDAAHDPATPTAEYVRSVFPHGAIGVFLFFVISGYILAYPFLKSAQAGKSGPNLSKFYLRRLTRLEPPYIIVMTLCFLALFVFGVRPSDAPRFSAGEDWLPASYVSSLFYLHTLVFSRPSFINPPTWSLEVEVVFYILAPLIFLIYVRIGHRPLRIAVGMALVLVLSVSSSVVSAAVGYSGYFYFSFGNYLHYFLLGVMISDYAVNSGFRKSSTMYDAFFVVGLVAFYLVGLTQWMHLETGSNVTRNLAYIPAILLIFFGGMQGRYTSALLSNVYISLLGGACYSIYLLHVPVMQFVHEVLVRIGVPEAPAFSLLGNMTLMVIASIAAGLVFYVLIERPCMNPDWPQRLLGFFEHRAARLTGRS